MNYLSPDASNDQVLAVPLGAVYAIRSNGETDFYLTSVTGQ
jgi:mannose-6-phosphate isomerase-like protein (cupin superfamily)